MANPDKERTDKIYAKDDEVTLIFSKTDDDEDNYNYNHENENDEGTDTEEPQLSRSHEHLKRRLDYLIRGDYDEDEEYEETYRSSVVEAYES